MWCKSADGGLVCFKFTLALTLQTSLWFFSCRLFWRWKTNEFQKERVRRREFLKTAKGFRCTGLKQVKSNMLNHHSSLERQICRLNAHVNKIKSGWSKPIGNSHVPAKKSSTNCQIWVNQRSLVWTKLIADQYLQSKDQQFPTSCLTAIHSVNTTPM